MKVLEWHHETVGPMSWDEAVKYCNDLGDGWRLPSVHELFRIIDFTKYSPASLIEMKPKGYWSSTTLASHSGIAWYVNFSHGYVSLDGKSSNFYVRAVRGGQLNQISE